MQSSMQNGIGQDKRLFIAIDLPKELKEYLHQATSEYFYSNNAIRIIPVENIHLTLKFLGGTDVSKIPKIFGALHATSSNFSRFDYKISGSFEAFPTKNSARIIFAGVKEGEEKINEIFKVLEKNLEKIRIKKEERKFISHITVARIRDRENISSLLEIANLDYSKPVVCDRLTMFESILKPSGAQYTILEEFALQ